MDDSREFVRSDAAAAALGRAWLADDGWDLLTRLTELDDRLGGHPGDRRAAELVADAFADAGVRNVREEPFELNRWTRGRTELAVTVPERSVERSFEAVALPYSPAYEGDAPLVDVGYGTPAELDAADVAGAVAVTRTATPPDFGRPYHRAEKVGHAAAAGAEAFVFTNHVPGQLPPTGSLRFDAEAAIPGVGVSAETGDWLREYASEGARARLRVDADTEPGTSRNVVGALGPGPEDAGDGDTADGDVVVVAHFDAHDVGEGALDNGCGIATVAGMARILAEMDLDRRVLVAGVSCEELGLIGSEALAASRPLEDVHAVVNVDGAGRYRDLNALVHGSEAVADLATGVADAVGHPVSVQERPHPYSDHWPFLREGIPALQLHSKSPDAEGTWDRGWTHTRADTRDKADRRNLRAHAMLAALFVRAVAATDLPRLDPDDLRRRLEEYGADEGMRAAGIWPGE
ncbi:M28 family metallopeptidase [Halosimplex salinum]|uniref:M28 family metallopeptidase n=1 Tax=Halosimplex salinum TaxID=1710538 RepID=UPI000F46A958|nr:M28 family metallopeptidase [Halosimplex salinum]